VQFDAMDFSRQSVQHGVGDGGVTKCLVPLGDRELRGDDGRRSPRLVFDHLEQVGRLVRVEGTDERVVDHEHDPGPTGPEPDRAPVAPSDGQKARDAELEGGMPVADGAARQGASEDASYVCQAAMRLGFDLA
jgi:hypothetical protein